MQSSELIRRVLFSAIEIALVDIGSLHLLYSVNLTLESLLLKTYNLPDVTVLVAGVDQNADEPRERSNHLCGPDEGLPCVHCTCLFGYHNVSVLNL